MPGRARDVRSGGVDDPFRVRRGHVSSGLRSRRRRRLAPGPTRPPRVSGFDAEVPHHAHVLVLEVVAVIKEEALVPLEAHAHAHPLSGLEQEGVLPAAVDETVADRRPGFPSARYDLELA